MSDRTISPIDATNHLQVALMVREKLAKPENWTIGVFARDKEGMVMSSVQSAYSFCLRGARFAVLDAVDGGSANEYAFCRFLGFEDPNVMAEYNNTHTHDDVLRCLDAAITKEFCHV